MFLTSEGEEDSRASATPNEMNLGEGGGNGESWPSALAVTSGAETETGNERTNDQAGIRAVELQPDFNTIQVCLVENIKNM